MLQILDAIPVRSIVLARRKSKYLPRAVESFASYIIKSAPLFNEYLKDAF